MRYKNWFFDFDDTLASGAMTWGIKYAFPQLIQRHGLTFDEAQFRQALLRAQEQASTLTIPDPMPVLKELFETLGWSLELRNEFLTTLRTAYVPEVFEDVLPFLQKLKDAGCRIFVVSNNPMVPDLIEHLPIREYVERVFTPKACGCEPKPHPGLWEYILQAHPDLDPASSVIVGDDPWSEGGFAQNCNLPCWIIDRYNRFADMQQPHTRVFSLAEIT